MRAPLELHLVDRACDLGTYLGNSLWKWNSDEQAPFSHKEGLGFETCNLKCASPASLPGYVDHPIPQFAGSACISGRLRQEFSCMPTARTPGWPPLLEPQLQRHLMSERRLSRPVDVEA